ncbi:MFS transporter [bacterium]|nr:MFS transporter [bacterium]
MVGQDKNSELTGSAGPACQRLPSGIWGLGFVSMFMDISSELVHSLLPIFMASVLGASMVTIGMIEGLAEGIAALTKVFSGALSDYCGRRKLLAVIGYSLSALTKPVFPLATTIGWVFGARFTDRIGKGIRGAPRDALIADLTPVPLRGAAYGLRQSLDSVGALIGPLLAVILMLCLANDIRSVLWWATVPAFIAVCILILAVHEPDCPKADVKPRTRLKMANIKQLSRRYWLIVLLGAFFTLARFSEAFLILRAQDLGLAIGYVPLIMIVMNIFYSVCAYPAGIAADRFSGRVLLICGLAVLVIADCILALNKSAWITLFGAAFWGLHMALTQGLFAKLIAETAPVELRGSAFGMFHLVSGLALFLASLIAGSLWTNYGASIPFIAGGSCALLAALGLVLYHPKRNAIQ